MRLHERAQRIADKYRNGQWIEDLKRELGMSDCKMCGGQLGELGTLGALTWFQCRQCGMEACSNASIKQPEEIMSEQHTVSEPKDYSAMSIGELAYVIRRNWKKVHFSAVPYLDAMFDLETVRDNYGQDSGKSIVLYFLGNATSWRGDTARAVKAELKRRCK